MLARIHYLPLHVRSHNYHCGYHTNMKLFR